MLNKNTKYKMKNDGLLKTKGKIGTLQEGSRKGDYIFIYDEPIEYEYTDNKGIIRKDYHKSDIVWISDVEEIEKKGLE